MPAAKARYNEALRLLPNYPRAWAGLAQVAIAQGQGKEALVWAQKLVNARPQHSAYRLLLGDAYKAANQPKEAERAWQIAAKLGNPEAKRRLKP
jgi:tetratricopeptide (TPR) repeat protein